jgi:hypothetical protein
MDVRREIRVVFKSLLASGGDSSTMLALADLLEEVDENDLAFAYRYAAKFGHWPFRRRILTTLTPGKAVKHLDAENWGQFGHREVWDWEADREFHKRTRSSVDPRSWLHRALYHAIRGIPLEAKKYGGIHRAFVLLAQGLRICLDAYHRTEEVNKEISSENSQDAKLDWKAAYILSGLGPRAEVIKGVQ